MIDKLKKIAERGIKSSVKTIFYQKRRPFIKRKLKEKFSARNSFNDKAFFYLIKLNYISGKEYSSDTTEKIIEHFDNREYPKFILDSKSLNDIVNLMRKNYLEEINATLMKAELALNGNYKWITPNCPIFENKIDWHSTFEGKDSWPLDFFMNLDYSSEKRPGDVRQNWELNRHQYFITLGKSYIYTKNEKYAEEFARQIENWINSNPVGFGIHWLHSQETAIRLISWIWAYHFFKESPNFSSELKLKFFKSLYEHAEYTYLTLSHDLITHNHLVSEICGLLFFSVLFPEFKASDNWKKTGVRIFERELLKQVWEDGPQAELSTNYHLFVLDSFINVKIILELNGHKLEPIYNDRIEKMIDYVKNFVRHDGSFPLIGDNDSGRVYKLSEKDANDRRSYLSTGAVLFSNPDFKYFAGRFFEESFWLLGINGYEKFKRLESKLNSEIHTIYNHAGNLIFKSAPDNDAYHLFFRIGPQNLRKEVSVSHNHADLLSFCLSFGGENFFIDPGTYLYSDEDEWRYYFRSTNAHSTISVDNEDQIDVRRYRFGLPAMKTSKILGHQMTDEYIFVSASHSAYQNSGIVHNRKVFFHKESFLIIIDQISGDGDHRIRRNFNVGRSKIQKLDNSRILLKLGKNKVHLKYLDKPKIEIEKGSLEPIAGWASEKYGKKNPASVIYDERLAELPLLLGVMIYPDEKSDFNFSSKNFEINNQKFVIRDGTNEFKITMDDNLTFSKSKK